MLPMYLQELRPINEDHSLDNMNHNGRGGPKGRIRSLCQRVFHLKDGEFTSDGVDKSARVLFPLTFVLFNICYWIYYLQPTFYTRIGS